MVIAVMATLAACAGALFFVLNRPVARDKRRNKIVSVALLSLSALGFVAGLTYAAAGWLSG